MDQYRTLKVINSTLWKVTLGFLPFYVNLNKRLYDENEAENARQQEQRTMVAEEEEENDTVIRDIKEVLTYASTKSVPEADWSDISESSTGGWSDSDTEYHSGVTVTTEGSYQTCTSKSASVRSYSGSEWAFAWPPPMALGSLSYSDSSSVYSASETSSSYYSVWNSEYLEWRTDPNAADLGWMEQISRAFVGSSYHP